MEDGGILTGFGGDGAETAYIKAGGTFNYTGNGTPGGTTVYYEPGAIINGGFGAYAQVQCPNIGVIYPTGTTDLCTPYTYLWSTGGTNDTIEVTNQTDATYDVTVYQGSNLSEAKCTGSVVVYRLPYYWVGGHNANDWSTPANWSPPGIPNSCLSNIIIPINGNDPVVNSPVSVGNITITGSGRELIQLNSSLSVCGNWTDNSGTSSYASGSQLILNGSSAQTLSGSLAFDQLAIANTNGGVSLAVGTTVGVNTALLLQTGNLNTGNGTVTLNSTSVTQAAIIDNFSAAASPGNGTITGHITAQRFYGAASILSDSKQHMLGSPVNGINLSALGSTSPSSAYYEAKTGGIHNCDELVGQYETPYGNVFTYDETHASTCTMDGWKVGADTTAVSAGTGYSVVLGSGSGTLAITGSANLNTTYSVPATNSGYPNTTSDQGRVYSSGINLLSNPYPASLDPTKLISDNPAFSEAVYVWDESTGSYYQPTSIAPFQAFMVFLGSPGVESSANYVINGTSRTTTEGSFQRVDNPIELSITVTNTSSGLTDETTVGFNPSSTTTFNQQYDLIKFPGALGRHTLYSLNSNDWMWVNILKSIDETSTVSVGFEPGVSDTYVATFNGINSFDPTSYVTLEDLQTGAIHDVRSGDYSFTSNASDNFNRFVLHFTPPAIILTQDASCETEGIINIEQPGTANWNYTVNDVNNVTVSSGVLNSGNPVLVSVSPGVYTLTLADNTGYTVVKMVQVQGSTPITAAFRTSETTALVSDNIQFTGTTGNASTYKWDFGDGTAGIGQQTSHSYQLAGVYTAKLMVTSGSGCISSTSQTITVNPRSVTGISNMTGNDLNIWSYENTVFVDFSKVSNVDAEVQLYNVLGQLLSDERFGKSTLYSKDLTNMEAAYIIVKVITGTQIVTKKVFIANVGK